MRQADIDEVAVEIDPGAFREGDVGGLRANGRRGARLVASRLSERFHIIRKSNSPIWQDDDPVASAMNLLGSFCNGIEGVWANEARRILEALSTLRAGQATTADALPLGVELAIAFIGGYCADEPEEFQRHWGKIKAHLNASKGGEDAPR